MAKKKSANKRSAKKKQAQKRATKKKGAKKKKNAAVSKRDASKGPGGRIVENSSPVTRIITGPPTSDGLAESPRTRIAILGDLQIDTINTVLTSNTAADSSQTEANQFNWESLKQHHLIHLCRPGGIWLLAGTLKDSGCEAKAFPEFNSAHQYKRSFCPESMATLKLFPKSADARPAEQVLRIDGNVSWVRKSNCDKQRDEVPSFEEQIQNAGDWLKEAGEGKPPVPIVILWDRNNGFRSGWRRVSSGQRSGSIDGQTTPDGAASAAISSASSNPPNELDLAEIEQCQLRDLLVRVADNDGYIIWQRSAPFEEEYGRVWGAFFGKSSQSVRDVCERIRARTVAIIRSECLQSAGMRVSKDASVERVVENFVEKVDCDPVASLSECMHLIVWYQEGALLLSNDDRGSIAYTYCPNAVEEIESTCRGVMSGYTSIVTIALAMKLCYSQEEIRQRIRKGLRYGTLLCAAHCRRGYGTKDDFEKYLNSKVSDDFPGPYVELFKTAPMEMTEEIPNDATNADPNLGDNTKKNRQLKEDYLLAELVFSMNLANPGKLSRVDSFLQRRCSGQKDSRTMLIDIVVQGIKAVGRMRQSYSDIDAGANSSIFPEVDVNCPFAAFGKLETADRDEIDKYLSISALISNYFSDQDANKPFSIATFGPPGAGKNFAIKAIIETLDKEAARHPLEFNVAQFTKIEDLTAVFHQAHDRAIEGITPLVVLDEFDADRGEQRLGWLKYFLAPMQDGLFKDGTTMYRVGRAIFLFAGGTKHTYEEFCEDQDGDEFRNRKGPDFVSRLRGHLDVGTINSDTDDVSERLMFRRAMILRSFITRKRPQFLDGDNIRIERSLAYALLAIPQYRHGVRSMEAIIEMSKGTSNRFEQSSLPSRLQLSMHVNMADFRRRIEAGAHYQAARSSDDV